MINFYCRFSQIFSSDEQSGYKRFIVNTNDTSVPKNKYGVVVCEGLAAKYPKECPLYITGEIVSNDKGEWVKVAEIQEKSVDAEDSVRFLTSKYFYGIGKVTAEKIVNAIGADIFDFASNHDVADLSFLKIDANILDDMLSRIRQITLSHRLFDFFKTFGEPYYVSLKAAKYWGENTLSVLERDAYRAVDVGTSLKTCDKLASRFRQSAYSESRIKATLKYLFNKIETNGNTRATAETIKRMISKEFDETETGLPALDFIVYKCWMLTHPKDYCITRVGDTEYYALSETGEMERSIVLNVDRLNNPFIHVSINDDDIDKLEQASGYKHGAMQRKAFKLVETNGVKLLIGGPGTGKTTTLNDILNIYESNPVYGRVILCAPTGRAAKRMSEVTKRKAVTIHSLLEIKPFEKEPMPTYNRQNPLPAGFVVVDEVSMVDTRLMALLLNAIAAGSLLLLVGDENQLPSVGCGQVLHDFIASERFEMVKLTEVYRQSKTSSIISNASLINMGSHALSQDDSFEIVECNSAKDVMQTVKEKSDLFFNPDKPFDCQIFCPVKNDKFDVSTASINNLVRRSSKYSGYTYKYGKTEYRVGDKIMMLANNYDKAYFNGDLGIITNIIAEPSGEHKVYARFDMGEREIESDMFDDMTLAYGITVHKSQGSECDTAIIALSLNPKIMLQRNLLYTAVTRASNKAIIVTEQNAMDICISSGQRLLRETGLYDKLKKGG